MLLRDRDAALVLNDVAQWMSDRAAPLPSGDERLTGAHGVSAGAVTDLPTCRTVADRLREHPAFAAQAAGH
jgi:hypothetical protein